MLSRHSTTTATRARDPIARPRIGPNSVLQTWRALEEMDSLDTSLLVRARAALPNPLPGGIIPEGWFVRLVRALRETVPPAQAEAVLRRSGKYTADYVAQNRIPVAFRRLLAALPPRVAIPFLLYAFRRHAWTFAGGGRFTVEGAYPGTLVLDGCPTCRADARGAHDGECFGAYYEAAFEGLLRLASRDVRVREVTCKAHHDSTCRFRISLEPPAS